MKWKNEIKLIMQQINAAKGSWNEARPGLKISKEIDAANKQYEKLINQLDAADAGDPSEYGILVKQQQDLEEKLKGFEEKRKVLAAHRLNAKECLDKILDHRTRITKLRDGFLKQTLINNSYVKIDIIPFGNKALVEEEFRDLIGRGCGGFDRDIGTVDGDEGLLSILTLDSIGSMSEKIKTLKSSLLAIYNNKPEALSGVKDKRFITYIQALTPEQIDRIRCWFPGDSLDVKYGFNDSNSFKPVEQGSPGQKTAALLAFILSYGNEPLVFDQPEDDLNNHLIYDLIVKQLRETKQMRQILIVTHNANIVVNGDAENVIAFDIKSGQTKIVVQGGLQESSIRDEICRVLEGGKEAFEQRYKRINAS